MSARKIDNTRREQAERWAARLAAPDCSSRERRAFEQWRAQDPAHGEAFADTERLLAAVDDLAATDPRLSALMDKARMTNLPAPGRWRVPAALAAGAALLAAGLYLYTDVFRHATAPVRYATDTAPSAITLDDGSVIHLDAASQVVTRMSGNKRAVELTRGRAIFEVVQDAGNPFVVSAGGVNVNVLGTQFQVERLSLGAGKAERVLVTLAEGAVNVLNEPRVGGKRRQERLVPGDQLLYSASSSDWTKRRVDTAVAMSWHRGRLAFRGAPLEEALIEINRYSAQKILLGDPSLGGVPIQGNFFAGDPAAIVLALKAVLPLRAEQDGSGNFVLLPEPSRPPG